QGQTADDGSAGPGLGGLSQLTGGLVGVRGVVLGEIADGAAACQTTEDGHVHAPAAQQEVGEGGGDDGGQHGSGVGAPAQGGQQLPLGGSLFGADEEGADDGAQNAYHGQ